MATIDSLVTPRLYLSEEEFFHFIKDLRQSRRVSQTPSNTPKAKKAQSSKSTDKLLSRLSSADKEALLEILKITS
jgi:hypothetical protein